MADTIHPMSPEDEAEWRKKYGWTFPVWLVHASSAYCWRIDGPEQFEDAGAYDTRMRGTYFTRMRGTYFSETGAEPCAVDARSLLNWRLTAVAKPPVYVPDEYWPVDVLAEERGRFEDELSALWCGSDCRVSAACADMITRGILQAFQEMLEAVRRRQYARNRHSADVPTQDGLLGMASGLAGVAADRGQPARAGSSGSRTVGGTTQSGGLPAGSVGG